MSGNAAQRALHDARNKKARKAEVAQMFERAVALQKAGSIPDVKAVLRQLLALAPKHFDALCLLGVAAVQSQSYQEAEAALGEAVGVEPRSAKAHFHRSVVLLELQQFEAAEKSCRRAIALDPRSAPALNTLGNICMLTDRLAEAAENYEKALVLKPDIVNAWCNLGMVRHRFARQEEALSCIDKAIELDSRYKEALNLRGMVLRLLGRPDDALDSYDRALAVDPRLAEVFHNRGNLLCEMHRFAEARDSYERAIALSPDFAEAHNGRGGALLNLRDFEGALASLQRAIAIKPDYADAISNCAAIAMELSEFEQAVVAYERALELAPGMAEGWIGRGNALHQLKRLSEALLSCEQALALDPRSLRGLVLMGRCLATLGQVDASIAKFDEALTIKPDCEDAIWLKIFTTDFKTDLTFEEQRDVRRLWWDRIGSRFALPPEPHRNERDPDRRLVIGYVSSDFRDHSAAWVFKPVIEYLDRVAFEVVCYSSWPIEDNLTRKFQAMACRWRDASRWSDERLIEQIRSDRVDILVDLSGHTSGNRLKVFARKPAPIQAHGWGHGTPPGLPTIDYVFCDPVTIPPDVRHLFHETIYDLPCMLTIEPLPADVSRGELPARGNRFVTFGVFNRISKITDESAEAWARILARVPGSRLLIKDSELDDRMTRENLLARFVRYGVAADLIQMRGRTPRPDHLQAMNAVDIFLDPFPQNGGASTWESLQMGVPVVAKLGTALSSRLAGGILSSIGLRDWVADDTDGYIEIAVRRAGRIDELAELRRRLPAQIAASKAGNPVAYAASVGKAYREIWRTYCKDGR